MSRSRACSTASYNSTRLDQILGLMADGVYTNELARFSVSLAHRSGYSSRVYTFSAERSDCAATPEA